MVVTSDYKVIGSRPIRHDGIDKVTGRAKYGADQQIAGLLHAKVLRSPHAHARIIKIDVSAALAHPGVKGVVTGPDMPNVTGEVAVVEGGEAPGVSLNYYRQNILALDKVLYKGHPVAAVAATSVHIAEEALDLIKVEYEVLPYVLTAPEAMKDDAPILLEDLTTKVLGQDTGRVSNVASQLLLKLGDPDKAFEDAEVVVEREFNTSTVHQGYLEPHTATVLWDSNDEVTVWCSSQGPFYVRNATAALLGISQSKVKVIPMEIGGGFGGKITVYLEPIAGVLSKLTGAAVKMTMTRAEVLESTGPTSGCYIKLKVGATQSGTIVAAKAHLAFEAGAYPGSPVGGAARCMLSPYNIEHLQVDGYDVVVNKPKVAAYRAPGAPEAAYAMESVVDEICEIISMDPLEFRILNAAQDGDRRADGVLHTSIGNGAVLDAAKNSDHYKSELSGPNRGRGIATGFWGNAGLQSSCSVNVNADGTVNLVSGSVDIGGSRVALAMQAAEVLGIAAEDVHPMVADTNAIGFTAITGGSRTAFATGWAAYEAANDVISQMKERAALLWETTADNVEFSDGIFCRSNSAEQTFTFKQLAGRVLETGSPITGNGTVSPKGVGVSFGHHIVDVEVDPETGKVDILRYTAIQDVGKAIHPSYVEGQLQGGAVQGIGWALNEEYFYNDKGVMTNSSLLDYRMPTSLDLPMIDTILVENSNPGHPFGVRGVAELPLVPPLGALANAIHNAVGVRMYDLPMNPGRILRALWTQKDAQ